VRYTETKDQSAELLRAALRCMGQHDAALNPLSFAVWYEFSAGTNLKLNEAIERSRTAEPRFSDETIGRLFREHIADADGSALQHITTQLQASMRTMMEGAARTGERAGLYGKQLSELSSSLETGSSDAVVAGLRKAAADTEEMKGSARELQEQVLASRKEIDLLRSDLSRARDEAVMDSLTGILNRKGLDEKLGTLLASEGAVKGSHCLVMLDIDHFKRVNDTYGHVMGDRVLQALGQVLRTSVATGHWAARFGGEEFAVLLPDSSIEEAMRMATTLRQRAKALVVRDRRQSGVAIAVTVSLGVTALLSGDDAMRFIARADAALYRSKQEGRDRVSFS
jgi:diguanylate cyclase